MKFKPNDIIYVPDLNKLEVALDYSIIKYDLTEKAKEKLQRGSRFEYYEKVSWSAAFTNCFGVAVENFPKIFIFKSEEDVYECFKKKNDIEEYEI